MSSLMSDRVQSVAISLNDQLLDALDAVRNLVGERVSISASLANGLGLIRVDPGAMRDAILNLAGSACNAMPNAGNLFLETENISFESEEAWSKLGLAPGEYVCLTVSDIGAAVAPESHNPKRL